MKDIVTRVTSYLTVTCPHCEKVIDALDHIGRPDTRPRAGAIIVCLRCDEPGVLHTTRSGLQLRTPTAVERDRINAHPDMRTYRAAKLANPTSPADALLSAQLDMISARMGR